MSDDAMISYSSGTSDAPLLGITIGRMLDTMAGVTPDAEALVGLTSARRWSYRELVDDTDSLARGLIGIGIQAGDRVGIWASNCAEWVLIQYATAKVGAILVNVNPAYRSHEVDFVIRQSEMRLMVCSRGLRDVDYRQVLDSIGFSSVVVIGEEGWRTLLEQPAATRGELEARTATLAADQPINIQYTSGTTGFPKGATLSHHSILNNGYFVGRGIGYGPADRVCLPVPLYHCFGMVMGVLGAHTHGACVVLPSPTFNSEATLRAVQSERCTSLYGVPTMFIAELSDPTFGDVDLSSLRTGIMAGSPCPAEVMKRVIADMNMREVAICYGMTETSPVSTMTASNDDLDARTTTIGRVMPHLEVKIVDDSGLVVPIGVPGELCTRGYSVMLGYWEQPDKTAEAIDAARWMHTGDVAVMDARGRLRIVGRSKDVVIRGGENIYPREIEEFLYSHPAVSDVQVIGVPDARYGEELMAWVILRPGAGDLTAQDVYDFTVGKLAHFKIPRYVYVVDSYPMTVTGKVRKVEMRELAADVIQAGRASEVSQRANKH
jgi:fatty-acyl-CoA synthase